MLPAGGICCLPELTVTELAKQVAEARTLALDAQTALNIVWTLLCGFLVMFMQAGFALVETGLTRAKNVAHTMGMNFLVYSIGILGYWAIGFGLQMGGVGALGTFGNDATLSQRVRGPPSPARTSGCSARSGFFLTPAVYTSADRGAVPVPDGVHGHHGDDPHGRAGRALEVPVVRAVQLRDRGDHLPDLRATGSGAAAGCRSSGRTSGSATATSTSRAARSSTWSGGDGGAGRRGGAGAAHRQVRPRRPGAPDPRAQRADDGARHVHPRVRLVRLQRGLDAVGDGRAHRGHRGQHDAGVGQRRVRGVPVDEGALRRARRQHVVQRHARRAWSRSPRRARS